MSKRRAHRKSRGGCAECKRRHIKCDEQKPQCLHCIRHTIPCIYRQTLSVANELLPIGQGSPRSAFSWQSIGPDDSTHILLNNASVAEDVPRHLFEMSDMALLHHWITVAGHSILNTHELDHYWHSVIPLIGFKYRYVIHSILSLSALHIAYTSSNNRVHSLAAATEHRSRALDGFAVDLENVGPDNSCALFANATLTFFYAFISFSRTFDLECIDSKARTSRVLGSEWIPLVRGTAAVLEPVYDHVRRGPLRSFLDLHNYMDLDPNSEVHISAFNDQCIIIQSLWDGDENAELYNETLYILRKCSAYMAQFDSSHDEVNVFDGYNRFYSGPFIWLFSVSEKYLVLQQQRQPHALIIFAYYGALLHSLNNYWWAEGCGQSIVNTVDGCLGPYWSSWIDWPKQAVGLP